VVDRPVFGLGLCAGALGLELGLEIAIPGYRSVWRPDSPGRVESSRISFVPSGCPMRSDGCPRSRRLRLSESPSSSFPSKDSESPSVPLALPPSSGDRCRSTDDGCAVHQSNQENRACATARMKIRLRRCEAPTADAGILHHSLSQAEAESYLRDVADELAAMVVGERTGSLRALGNGVVPLQAAAAFVALARRFASERER
jgi:hypothetical protein